MVKLVVSQCQHIFMAFYRSFSANYSGLQVTSLRRKAKLRTSDWRPRPDVYGVLEEVEGRYPIKPVDVAFEVYSEDEEIAAKCQEYSKIGVPQVFVFFPEKKTIARWDGQNLIAVNNVELANGVIITGVTIWSQLEKRRHREPPASLVI